MKVRFWRTSSRTASLLLLLLVLVAVLDGVNSYNEFEILVPTGAQMGVYGETVVLPCTFPVGASWDADTSVITWQRNVEVVHSFYHSRDQPQYQSERYANRTSLFHLEMEKGNASLRLHHTTLEDAGEYTCSISTRLGSQRKSFYLKVAALYHEPQLHISMLNNGQVEVQVTSEGGFPSPSLQWLVGNMNDITNDTHTDLRQDQRSRLYSVTSKLNLSGTVNSSITFIMKNPDLGQEIRRKIQLFSERNGGFEQNSHRAVIALSVGVMLLFILIVIFYRLQRTRNRCSREPSERNIESPDASGDQTITEKSSADGVDGVADPLIKERREG